MEDKISSILSQTGQMLIHSIQIKLRSGIAKTDRIAVLSNICFSIFQKLDCRKSVYWVTLSAIKITENSVTFKFGKNVFHIFPLNLKLFLSCIFDVIQRVLLPSELEKLDFESFHSFVALPNPFSVYSRMLMKIKEEDVKYDRLLVQQITDTLSYSCQELDLTKFDPALISFMIDATPLYYGLKSVKISSTAKVDAYQYAAQLALEKTTLRIITVKGTCNSNFSTYLSNLSLNKSPKLMSLSFESSFFKESHLNEIKNLYNRTNLKGLEFHDAISSEAKDFFHDCFFSSLRIKSLNLDGTKGLRLSRILILVPGLVLLSLANCDLDISDVIPQIQNLTKLRALNLSGNRCTNAAKLKTPLPPNVLSLHVNNVTWENQCLVEFFNYRVMKLSIAHILTSNEEWQRLFDSLPNNPNNALANIVWDGNYVHSNFFEYLKKQVCLHYLSMNDCLSYNHPECLSYFVDFLRHKELALNEISLRGTDSNNLREYLLPVLQVLLKIAQITIIDIKGQNGGDQSYYELMGNMDHLKIVSCDKNNPSKGAILFDLADKAKSNGTWLSYPSEDISSLVQYKKMSTSESRALYNKFRMFPKRSKKQPPGVLYPPPSNSAFDSPYQAYKYHPNADFPRYLKEKQFAFYDRAPPMAKIGPDVRRPNGQKQTVSTPGSPNSQSPQGSPLHSPVQQNLRTFDLQQNERADPTLNLDSPPSPQNYNGGSPKLNQNYNNQHAASQRFTQNYDYNIQQLASTHQINNAYNMNINTNQRFGQTYNNNRNSNQNSPSSSRNRPTQNSWSPISNIYNEASRPPPPRFVYLDDPITLEKSLDDETLLPTIEDGFFPNYDEDSYDNQNQQQQMSRNVKNSPHSDRSKSRGSPSRNNRRSPSRKRRDEDYFEEEEEIFDDNYNRRHSRTRQKRSSSRKRHYEDENVDDFENEYDLSQRHSKSVSRNNHRSTSRQHRHHYDNNNNVDYEDNDYENDNYNNNRNNSQRRKNKDRNIPPSSQRVRRVKARIYYESNNDDDFLEEEEEIFENEDYRDHSNHRRRSSSRTPNDRGVSPSSRSSNNRKPESRQRSHQQQQQQQQRSSRRRKEADNQIHTRSKRDMRYNDDVDYDDENNNDYDYENNDDFHDGFDNYKYRPKSQTQKRISYNNVQKQQQRGKTYRSRNIPNDDFNDDYDNYDGDENDDSENYHPRARQKQQQTRKQSKRRSETALADRRRQNVSKNHNQVNRQQEQQSQRRSRNDSQRMNNYNKDFYEENNYDDYDINNNEEYDQSDYDESQSSHRKRIHSQRKPSRNHSRKQSSQRIPKESSHNHRIVRNINHNGSPKPARRPAPRYVKQFEFSSSNSFE